MKKIFLILVLISFLFEGCEENNLQPVLPPENLTEYYVIINEGLYGQNNSSITIFDLQTDETKQYVYSAANNGNNLGDTANDFVAYQNTGFIVLDKSKKIEIVDLSDFHSLGFIDFSDYGNPRNIIIFDSTHAYVSTLNNLVVEINPSTHEIINTVEVGNLPEGMAISSNKLFVANSGFGTGNSVSVIDLNSLTNIGEITVWRNPRYIKENDNFVYVVSTGEFIPPGTGAITKINTESLTPIDTLILEGNPGKCEITNENLFVIYSEGIAKISLENLTIIDSTFITGFNVNRLTGVIYSVFYDIRNSLFLVGNPKDFMQNGEIVIFDNNGNKVSKFNCGLNPGTISLIKK